jgi:O-antigen ligase
MLLDMEALLGEGVGGVQSLAKGCVFLLCMALFFFFSSKRFSYKRYFLVFLYFFICCISVLWSENIILTLIGIISLSGALALCFLAVDYLRYEDAIRCIVIGAEGIVFLSFVLLFAGWESHQFLQGVYRYVGVTFGPHALARGAAIVIIYWAYLFIFTDVSTRSRFYGIVVIIISVLTINMADSRQVLGALIFSIAFSFWSFNHKKGLYLLLLNFVIGVVCLYFLFIDLGKVDLSIFVRSDIDEIITFTGRTFIWEEVVYLIYSNPWFGFGFNVGGEFLSNNYETLHGWTTKSAHNAVLHSLLDVGFFGMLALVLCFVFSVKLSFRSKNFLAYSLVLFSLVVSFIERVPAGNVSFMFVVFFITFIYLLRRKI